MVNNASIRRLAVNSSNRRLTELLTMKLTLPLALASAAAAFFGCATAQAADYDPPVYVDQAPDYKPVEVGSGWYLRGDLAYLPNRDYEHVNLAVTPVAFSDDEKPVFGSIGAGYHFNDYLRAELNIGYFPGQKSSFSVDDGATSASANLNNHAWTGMLNGYVDLGTYAGLTPYIGAGVGLYQSNRKLTASYDDGIPADSFELTDKKTQYSFAYTLNAGLAYQLSKNLLLDVGYQYLSAPDAEYQTIEGVNDYPVKKGLDYNQIKVGLRYDLW
jgi:opacity protein-like surface antigen